MHFLFCLLVFFLICFWTIFNQTQGFFMALHKGISFGMLGYHLWCWRWNLGWLHVKQAPCSLFTSLFFPQKVPYYSSTYFIFFMKKLLVSYIYIWNSLFSSIDLFNLPLFQKHSVGIIVNCSCYLLGPICYLRQVKQSHFGLSHYCGILIWYCV